jgi:hypothetical protein
MSAQVTMVIDKPCGGCYHDADVSSVSGSLCGRTGRGDHRRKGSIMVQVLNRGDTFAVRLACTICGERCRLNELWLGFPPGEIVRGEWLHKSCVDGKIHTVFGGKRVVLMRGLDALQRLAEALDDTADHPALACKRPLVTAKASRR